MAGAGGGGGYPTNYDGGYGGPNPTGWDTNNAGGMNATIGGAAAGGGRDGGAGGAATGDLKAPPPADSRYVVVDDGNASPRLVRSTTFAFPKTRGASEKVGVPLGLLCTPLGVGSDGCVARVVDGITPTGPTTTTTTSAAAAGAVGGADAAQGGIGGTRYEAETESVPLIRSQYPCGGPVRPHRCPRCLAYLNPFSRRPHVDSGSMIRGASLSFVCNFCGHSCRVDAVVDMNDPAYSLDLTAAATKFGTVEYELGGDVSPEYVTRDALGLGPVRQVILFGIDASSDTEMGNMLEYYVEAVRTVAEEVGDWWSRQGEEILRGPAKVSASGAGGGRNGQDTSSPSPSAEQQQADGQDDGAVASAPARGSNNPRVGFFLYQSDRIIIPHYRRKYESRADHMAAHIQDGISGEVAGVRRQRSGLNGGSDVELTLAVMADVTVDPFSPLPCYDFTYDVTDPTSLDRLYGVLDSVPEIVKHGFGEFSQTQEKPQLEQVRSCGGAALAVLSSALSPTGGRGILLTSHRPNFAIGALPDREVGGSAKHYQRIEAERELYTPLQHLVKRQISFASGDNSGGGGNSNGKRGSGGTEGAAANFYSQLGSTSAADRVVLDILLTTPLVEHGAVGAVGTGMPRSRFIDVATLSELCRHTCGKFRWIKFDASDISGYSQTLSEEIL